MWGSMESWIAENLTMETRAPVSPAAARRAAFSTSSIWYFFSSISAFGVDTYGRGGAELRQGANGVWEGQEGCGRTANCASGSV